MTEIEPIALFDMDGTLRDYIKGLSEELDKRINLITNSESFWENLPRFQLGWDVLKVAGDLNYKTIILTQGPSKKPFAWSGKRSGVTENCLVKILQLRETRGLFMGKFLQTIIQFILKGGLAGEKEDL